MSDITGLPTCLRCGKLWDDPRGTGSVLRCQCGAYAMLKDGCIVQPNPRKPKRRKRAPNQAEG